ncbi:MAG: DNA-directed RNA polymerase subunit omega, partial [Oscillospiraceae bacterium]
MMIKPPVTELVDKAGSSYLLVMEIAKRARQITEGAMPLPHSINTAKWDKVITDNISTYIQDKITFDEMIKNTQKGIQDAL